MGCEPYVLQLLLTQLQLVLLELKEGSLAQAGSVEVQSLLPVGSASQVSPAGTSKPLMAQP